MRVKTPGQAAPRKDKGASACVSQPKAAHRVSGVPLDGYKQDIKGSAFYGVIHNVGSFTAGMRIDIFICAQLSIINGNRPKLLREPSFSGETAANTSAPNGFALCTTM